MGDSAGAHSFDYRNLNDSGVSWWQDKLLEEMWKQQDSLDAPTATAAAAAETPGDVTEGGGASDDGSKDSNSLLERLRALEVKVRRQTHFTDFTVAPQV